MTPFSYYKYYWEYITGIIYAHVYMELFYINYLVHKGNEKLEHTDTAISSILQGTILILYMVHTMVFYTSCSLDSIGLISYVTFVL